MEHRKLYQEICEELEAGRTARLATVIADDKLRSRFLIHEGESIMLSDDDHHSDRIYTETIRPLSRLLILGGGHVARCLAEFAARCDFRVWVADDREEYACPARFPMAEGIMNGSFSENIKQMHLTSQDYVVVMTRGHHYDKECLRTILKGCRPAWTGMMGSHHRAGMMRQMLLEEGYDAEAVEMIRMPVGLKIGSVTPAEIAVSVLAELISVRHDMAMQCKDASEAEDRLLQLMMSEKAHVEVMVLKTSGSSPRKHGARMIVWQDGTISGSIGGGLAEAKAVSEAMQLMGTKCTALIHVQMMDIADDIHDGAMVCGGSMEILLCAYDQL